MVARLAVIRVHLPSHIHENLHYGLEVGPAYRGVGEMSWFLAQLDRADAGTLGYADARSRPPLWLY